MLATPANRRPVDRVAGAAARAPRWPTACSLREEPPPRINTDAYDIFGYDVALSADGSTLAVGAHNEDSAATGIDGDRADDSAGEAGAAYVFDRRPPRPPR